MSRLLLFTPAARSELIEAQDRYEREVPGLGRRFRGEIDHTVERIIAGPLHFPLVYKTVRRARVKVFPHALFFCIEDDALMVIACFHPRRNPKRWQSRV